MTGGRLKFALVSHYLPPSRYGQPRVIHRLLEMEEPSSYCLISVESYDRQNQRRDDDAPWLSGEYYKISLGKPWKAFAERRPFRSLAALVNAVAAIRQRASEIAAILRRENCALAVACSGDIADLPATWLACRRTGVKFIPYMFDDYVEQWGFMPILRWFASVMERLLIKDAEFVIVPNEFLETEYRNRYTHAVKLKIVHNPWLAAQPAGKQVISERARNATAQIVYTGSIYHVHFDAFRNLSAALGMLNGDAALNVYSATPPEILEANGVNGFTHYGHVDDAESSRVQQEADILFLPLAFNSTAQAVIRTSAPGKMGEYLASGRPVLVHAPEDTFIAWYFRQHACGEVITDPDPQKLAEAIRRLSGDVVYRGKLVAAARERAAKDFSPAAAREKFFGAIMSVAG